MLASLAILLLVVGAGGPAARVLAEPKDGAYGVASDGVPVAMTLILDAQARCGTATFPGPVPAPRCAFNASRSTLSCR